MATSFYRMDWFADELKLQKKLNRPDTTFDWISKEKFDISLRETLLTSTLSFLYDWQGVLTTCAPEKPHSLVGTFETSAPFDTFNKEMMVILNLLSK